MTPDTAARRFLSVDPDLSATVIRDQSEQAIRANAYRLVAGRRDALERRAELLTLAEKITEGEPGADELAAAALPYLTHRTGRFEDLIEAVLERGRFVRDPDEWLARHDLSLSTVVYETHDEKTQGDVDQALDVLCGGS